MRVLYLAVVVALTSAGCGGDGSIATSSTVPVAVSGGLTFQSVSVEGYHICGVTTAGVAYCWGDNGFGAVPIRCQPPGRSSGLTRTS